MSHKTIPTTTVGGDGGDAVIQCVEKGLDVLGPSGKAAVVYMLDVTHGIKANQIPEHPERFIMAVRTMFGVGSHVLMKVILDELRAARRNGSAGPRLDEFSRQLEQALRSMLTGIM